MWIILQFVFFLISYTMVKIKVNESLYRPGQAVRVLGGWGSQISWQSAHEDGKVVSPTHRPPLPPENIPGTHFCKRLSRPQGHSAAGRIMSMKNSNDTIGNWTRDSPACSAVPQPTAPPRLNEINFHFSRLCCLLRRGHGVLEKDKRTWGLQKMKHVDLMKYVTSQYIWRQ